MYQLWFNFFFFLFQTMASSQDQSQLNFVCGCRLILAVKMDAKLWPSQNNFKTPFGILNRCVLVSFVDFDKLFEPHKRFWSYSFFTVLSAVMSLFPFLLRGGLSLSLKLIFTNMQILLRFWVCCGVEISKKEELKKEMVLPNQDSCRT